MGALRKLLRKKRLLFALAVAALILDQRRRSREATRRYESIYAGWSSEPSTLKFLAGVNSALKAKLAKHKPEDLRAGAGTVSVDLAIAGGGAKVLYALGAYFVLQHAGLKVERASGASAGAYLAAVLVGDRYQLDDLLHENLLGWGDCVVRVIQEHKTLLLGKIWEFMSAELTKRLAGWLPAPGRLFVSVTTVSGTGAFEENLVTDFDSAEDLERSICASMSVPFILCHGPYHVWRGRCAIDGGFKNNCPISIFSESTDDAEQPPESGKLSLGGKPSDALEAEKRLIVKLDANKIATMPYWRKVLHVAYAPAAVCGKLIMEGAEDMLEALSTGKDEVSGVTLIRTQGGSISKRDFSYQLLPGQEHVGRLMAGKPVF